MKTILSLALLVGSSSSFAAPVADDPAISTYQRGIICRAIDAKYPSSLEGKGTVPGWIVCRDGGAHFAQYAPESDPTFLVVAANVGGTQPINCTARIQEPQKGAKSSSAVVSCWK